MEINRNITISIVGDPLQDSKNVSLIWRVLLEIGVKCLYFKDVDEEVRVCSVVVILNNNSEYGNDTNAFLSYSISKNIPIIVVYTDLKEDIQIHDTIRFTESVMALWNKIPAFEEEHYKVPTIHILTRNLKQIIKSNNFALNTNFEPSDYYLRNNQ